MAKTPFTVDQLMGAGCDPLGGPYQSPNGYDGMAGFAVKYPSFICRHFDIYVGHLPALFGDQPENSPQVIGNISFDDFDLDQQDLGGNLSWIEPSDLSQVAWTTMWDGRKKKMG